MVEEVTEGIELNGKKFAGLREINVPCPFCNERATLDLPALVKVKEGTKLKCNACGKEAFEVKKFEVGKKEIIKGIQKNLEDKLIPNQERQEITITVAILGDEIKPVSVDGKPLPEPEQPKPVKPVDPFLKINDSKYCTKGNDLIKIPWESGRAMIVGKIIAGLAWKDSDGQPSGEFSIMPLEGTQAFNINFDGARFLAIEGISPGFGKDKKKARDFLVSGNTKQEAWKAWGQVPIKIRIDVDTMTLIGLSTPRFQCHYLPDLMPALETLGKFVVRQMPKPGHGGIASLVIIAEEKNLVSLMLDLGNLDDGKEGIKIWLEGVVKIQGNPVAWNNRARAFSIKHQGLQKMQEAIKNMIEKGKRVPQALADSSVSEVGPDLAKGLLGWLVANGFLTRQEKIIGLQILKGKNPITVATLLKLIPYLQARSGGSNGEGAFGEVLCKFMDAQEWKALMKGLAPACQQEEEEKREKAPMKERTAELFHDDKEEEDEDLTGLD
jgi:hypothetical protein